MACNCVAAAAMRAWVPASSRAIAPGCALACSGAVMQGLFRNPLADPGLLGISSGAALAVALTIVMPLSLPPILALYGHMISAFAGSLAISAIVFALSRFGHGGLSRLLLAGIAINALCGAAVGVLTYVSDDQQLRQFSLWSMGRSEERRVGKECRSRWSPYH